MEEAEIVLIVIVALLGIYLILYLTRCKSLGKDRYRESFFLYPFCKKITKCADDEVEDEPPSNTKDRVCKKKTNSPASTSTEGASTEGATSTEASTSTRTDCSGGRWSETWSECQVYNGPGDIMTDACGVNGSRKRTLDKTTKDFVDATNGGTCKDEEYEICQMPVCPAGTRGECSYTAWQNTGDCSKDCGGGKQLQSRTETSGLAGCNTSFWTEQMVDCNIQACQPRDCSGSWIVAKDCTATGCGTIGYTYKKLDKTATDFVPAQHGGVCKDEKYELCETRNCEAGQAVDCSYSRWKKEKDDCPCGGPHDIKEIRSILKEAQNGGSCNTDDLERTVQCTGDPCPIDCSGSWSETGQVSNSGNCEDGERKEKAEWVFHITRDAKHGGNDCDYTHKDTQWKDITYNNCGPAKGSSGRGKRGRRGGRGGGRIFEDNKQ